MDDETRAYVGFSLFPGIGPVRFQLLLSYFGSAKAAWKASHSELSGIHLVKNLLRALFIFDQL